MTNFYLLQKQFGQKNVHETMKRLVQKVLEWRRSWCWVSCNPIRGAIIIILAIRAGQAVVQMTSSSLFIVFWENNSAFLFDTDLLLLESKWQEKAMNKILPVYAPLTVCVSLYILFPCKDVVIYNSVNSVQTIFVFSYDESLKLYE